MLPADVSQYLLTDLTRIQHAGDHLLLLVNNLLNLSKIEAGKMTVQINEFDVAEVISSMIQTSRESSDSFDPTRRAQ